MKNLLVLLVFMAITTTLAGQIEIRYGDVNDDSAVDIVDGLLTAQHYVGLDPVGFNSEAADVDADESITIIDALLIAQYYVGLIAIFPAQNQLLKNYGTLPTNYSRSDLQAAYDDWKNTLVTSEGARGFLRVRKPDSGSIIDSTVSEGIGYGMILAVYMDDRNLFDNLWKYEQLFLNNNGLMNWEIHPDGNSVIGTGAATDGDEDMAWALVMAHRKWGGSGTLNDTYLHFAVDLINRIYQYEFIHSGEHKNMLLPGDSWGTPDITNISYFAPAYYRVFGQVTGKVDEWNAIIDTNYIVLNNSLNAANGNENNGLVPAWSNFAGMPVEAYSGAPLHFQNDSTRTPFRIGQDYCYNGDPRAKAYLSKITSFYRSVGISNIVDGYNLDGTPHPDFSRNGGRPASFIGPAGVGGMSDPVNQAFIDEAYAAVATLSLDAGTIYYQKSWTALSLLMMTGGFVVLP
ncbi:MAG: hypothetical protein JXJ04_08970 [Spirochaetales bacterium]|nr:hypothetical protein [Spirochaetales bacterium]